MTGRKRTIDRSSVFALLKSGKTTREVAEEIGCSDWTVLQIAKLHGIKPPRKHKKSPTPEESRKAAEKAVSMRMDNPNISIADIAKKLGVSWNTVNKYLRTSQGGENKKVHSKKNIDPAIRTDGDYIYSGLSSDWREINRFHRKWAGKTAKEVAKCISRQLR